MLVILRLRPIHLQTSGHVSISHNAESGVTDQGLVLFHKVAAIICRRLPLDGELSVQLQTSRRQQP